MLENLSSRGLIGQTVCYGPDMYTKMIKCQFVLHEIAICWWSLVAFALVDLFIQFYNTSYILMLIFFSLGC